MTESNFREDFLAHAARAGVQLRTAAAHPCWAPGEQTAVLCWELALTLQLSPTMQVEERAPLCLLSGRAPGRSSRTALWRWQCRRTSRSPLWAPTLWCASECTGAQLPSCRPSKTAASRLCPGTATCELAPGRTCLSNPFASPELASGHCWWCPGASSDKQTRYTSSKYCFLGLRQRREAARPQRAHPAAAGAGRPAPESRL